MQTERLEFIAERDAELFASVPAAPAVFLLRAQDAQAEPYVSKTANLRRRLQRLLGSSTQGSRKLNLRESVRLIEYIPTGSDFESSFTLFKVLRQAFPRNYAGRLRFRFAPLVKLHLENPYPRASVTSRVGRQNRRSVYYGPFQSRLAAEKFINDSLDFFKMRRCVDDLHPDAAFPGCIYSEMKMCLAPCFKGCTDEEYVAEVNRVQSYFDSSGESLVRELSMQREAASANLFFEDAAAIHARLEKLNALLAQLSGIVRRLDRLSALIVQPCHRPECVAFFRVDAGILSGPQVFAIPPAEHAKSQSMESRVQAALESFPAEPVTAGLQAMEHLALLKRWYYRGSRVGEIFLADDKNILPMRRIVRGIGRVLTGEKPESRLVSPGSVTITEIAAAQQKNQEGES